jgi:zinc protease
MRNRFAILLVVFLFGGTVPAAAQGTEEAPLPSAEQIVQKCLQALGGREVVAGLRSSVSSGIFEGQGAHLPAELAFEAPGKWYFLIRGSNGPVFMQVSNGSAGWILTPDGVQEMPAEQRLVTDRLVDPQGPLKLADHYTSLEVKGKEKVSGHDAYVVEATPKQGKPDLYYFDSESGLILRIDFIADTERGSFPIQMHYEDYRDVGNTKIAHTLRQTGLGEWIITVNQARINEDVDDAKFEKPETPSGSLP